MAFFAWGLPLTMPAKIGGTLLPIVTLVVSGPAGRVAAGALALGMGISSALLLAAGGLLLVDWWGLFPAAALIAGLGLHAELRVLELG